MKNNKAGLGLVALLVAIMACVLNWIAFSPKLTHQQKAEIDPEEFADNFINEDLLKAYMLSDSTHKQKDRSMQRLIPGKLSISHGEDEAVFVAKEIIIFGPYDKLPYLEFEFVNSETQFDTKELVSDHELQFDCGEKVIGLCDGAHITDGKYYITVKLFEPAYGPDGEVITKSDMANALTEPASGLTSEELATANEKYRTVNNAQVKVLKNNCRFVGRALDHSHILLECNPGKISIRGIESIPSDTPQL